MPAATHLRATRNESNAHMGLALAGFLVASYAAAAIGSFAMQDWQPWYDALAKPSWTPPGALIGAVWMVLYGLMGVAAWLVWRERGWQGARVALGLWSVQLVLNALWTPLFFGAKLLGVAFAELVVLWLAILATTVAFARVRRTAAWLLVPYLAWVAFAGALNLTIWRMNA